MQKTIDLIFMFLRAMALSFLTNVMHNDDLSTEQDKPPTNETTTR